MYFINEIMRMQVRGWETALSPSVLQTKTYRVKLLLSAFNIKTAFSKKIKILKRQYLIFKVKSGVLLGIQSKI